MKKKSAAFISNVVILFGCICVCINFMPKITPYSTAVSKRLAPLAAPDYLFGELKSRTAGFNKNKKIAGMKKLPKIIRQ